MATNKFSVLCYFRYFSLFSLSLISEVSFCQYDFRNVNWGMSMAEVYSRENKSELKRATDISCSYETTIGNNKATVSYNFLNDKLFSIWIYLYTPSICSINLSEKYSRMKSFFTTLEARGFKNGCSCFRLDKQRITINTTSPIINKETLDYAEKELIRLEESAYKDLKGDLGPSWTRLLFKNERSDLAIDFYTPLSQKSICNLNKDPNWKMYMSFITMEASNEIYNQILKKAF